MSIAFVVMTFPPTTWTASDAAGRPVAQGTIAHGAAGVEMTPADVPAGGTLRVGDHTVFAATEKTLIDQYGACHPTGTLELDTIGG